MEIITSTQNSKIKRLNLLEQKSAARRESKLFVVEGKRELMHCVQAGYEVDSVYFCPDITGPIAYGTSNKAGIEEPTAGMLIGSLPDTCERIAVSKQLYEKIAYRGGTEGVKALVRERHTTLSELKLQDNPLIVVLEGVEKPGNLGAVLRSADASGADAIIVCDPLTDLYNPNLIRSSIGAIFNVPCVACSSEECIDFLKTKKIQILTAQLQDSKLYYDTPMTSGTAIVMGTEASGLTPQWRKAADAHIRIPMLGKLDSLNVSVSAAILLFEAVRQRSINA